MLAKVQQRFWSVFDNSYKIFEGIHRVQRVSATEKSDRRHSSTIMVSVIDDTQFKKSLTIRDDDIRVDTFRASGPGGQHRNKTDSGVRMTHIPSGTVVTATEDRSQHKNRHVARQRLEEKISFDNISKNHESMNKERKIDLSQVAYVWTQWRNQVKGPNNKKADMKNALNGKLDKLMK